MGIRDGVDFEKKRKVKMVVEGEEMKVKWWWVF